LYLEGQDVGTVVVKGRDNSGGYGDFTPSEQFAAFAPAYGLWSLLMHADEDSSRLSPAASSELASAESALDAIKARLFFPAQRRWVDVAQLTIDGELLEWREY
jgi:hypothetical protein